MNNVKNSLIFCLTIFVLCIFVNVNPLFATANDNTQRVSLEEKAKEILKNSNGNIDVTKLVTEYEELTKEYTNEEIADFIEKNKNEIIKEGISSDVVSAGTQVLRTMEPEKVTKILKEDIKIDEVKEKIDNGYTPSQIAKDISTTLTTKEKINIAVKLLLANKIFKFVVILFVIFAIYSLILRWIIFKKAGKHGFASIIPIYRDIVYFKVCGISPWVILFILLPVIGWLLLCILKIVSRFELSYNFGRKTGFGFGLLLLPIIFESIIAFSKKIKYVDD